MYDLFYRNPFMTTMFHCSRRTGKSAVDLVVEMESCLGNDESICRFGSLTQKGVEEIIKPIMATLTASAPEKLRPYWHSSGRYLFPHRPGSQLVVAGVDLNVNRLRGNASDIVALDESAFYKDLEGTIKDIVMPQFLTREKGKLILSSTSPKTPAHPFVKRLEKAQDENAYVKQTIYEDSRPEVIARIPEFMKESGGEGSTTWRREYLCEIIVDEESAIVPEFSRPEVRERVVKETEIPPHFVAFTAIDLGYIDNAAAVFGFVDFKSAKRVVIDELLLNRKNSRQIAEGILAKEEQIWGPRDKRKHQLRRYADGQPLTIADFNDLHRVTVTKVAEDTVEAKANSVRVDVQNGTLVVWPRCKQLIREMQHGVWNDAHTGFARIEGTFGHFDLLSALTYFVRHTNLNENPFPVDYNFDPHEQQRSVNWTKKDQDVANALRTVFRM